MLLYLPAPLCLVSSAHQLAEVTLQLHQNFTTRPASTGRRLQKSRKPLVSFVTSWILVNSICAGLMSVLPGPDQSCISASPMKRCMQETWTAWRAWTVPWNLRGGAQCSWTATKMTAFIMMQRITDEALFWKCLSPTGQTGQSQSVPRVTLLPNGNTGKSPSRPRATFISGVSHSSAKSKHLCLHHTNVF